MGKKIYVGNLPYSTTDQSLGDAFAAHGTVSSARVIMDRDSGRSKGFGFVEMTTDSDAMNAIRVMDGSDMDGRPIKVSEAKPQAPREDRGGGYGSRSRW